MQMDLNREKMDQQKKGKAAVKRETRDHLGREENGAQNGGFYALTWSTGEFFSSIQESQHGWRINPEDIVLSYPSSHRTPPHPTLDTTVAPVVW